MADNQAESSANDDENGVYDPFKHRTKKQNVSDFSSLCNLVKSAAGTGLFAMPYAFSNVGLLSGILGTMLLGLILRISLQLLMKSHYTMCVRTKQPMLKYDQVVAATMTTGIMKGRISHGTVAIIFDGLILICYLGIGAIYVIFVANIIQECIDEEKTVGEAYYSLIIIPFFILINMIRGLNDIAPISIIGIVFLVASCIIGIVYAFKHESNDDWILLQSDIKRYPTFISIVFYSLCSPGLILEIEHSMKNPENYTRLCGVLNWGMFILVLVHVVVGSIGYYKWGNATLSNFILNHDELDVATLSALILQALAIYFTYSIQCYPLITLLYEEYALKSIKDGFLWGTPYIWNIIVRISVTLLTCIFAAAVPKLHLFVNFVGSLCMGTLGFLLPLILFIVSSYGNFDMLHWKSFIILFVFIIGLCAMTFATASSIISIINYATH